jgi:hypothetical protein
VPPGSPLLAIGDVDPLQRGEGRGLGLGAVVRGQAFALLGIEHGVAFEEGDFTFHFRALGVGLGAGDAIGIDDKLATLAFFDVAPSSSACLKVSHSGQA